MYPHLFTTPGLGALAEELDAERGRQLAKFGDQRHPDGTGPHVRFLGMSLSAIEGIVKNVTERNNCIGEAIWLPILLEEVFEALAEPDPAQLRAELVQVAAVCAAWISDIDRRPGSTSAPATTRAADHG